MAKRPGEAHRREEIYNSALADLLRERVATNPEAELRHPDDAPDVLFEWLGLPGVLEVKYDAAGAQAQVAARSKNG